MNDYKELISKLHSYSQDLIAYKLGCEFADTVNDAADAIEQLAKDINVLAKERDELTTKCCRLEQEHDAAVAAVHKQCSTCKRVDFCATDAGQPTLWACVSAAKCNWEWRGVQKEAEHENC